MKNITKTYLVRGILLIFSFYLLPVNADDVVVSSATPIIDFDDNGEAGIEWNIIGDQNIFVVVNDENSSFLIYLDDEADMQLDMRASTFQIQDQIGAPIFSVHRDAPELALDIQSNGDVSLAGGDVFIDTSLSRLGIGTTTPEDDLHITSTIPSMIFSDTSTNSTDWYVGNLSNDFVFLTLANGTGGPVGARILTLDAQTGFVGMGGAATSTPTAPLHVASAAGNTKIRVEETNATVAARSLYELYNNGPVGFNMFNTDTGETWRFAAQTTGFRASLAGSGGPEFEVTDLGGMKVGPGSATVFDLTPSGNLTISGILTQSSDVNSKRDIDAVDGAQVLTKLARLPISEWTYKGDDDGVRHLGPMAQDFYAAFGLGATDTGISSIDTAGVALAAIQALNQKLVAQNQSLEQRVTELEQQNQRIEELVMRVVKERAEQVAYRG